MKLSARSAAWVLPFLLTGCFHKPKVTQSTPLAPPIEETTPVAKPETSASTLPPPEIAIPAPEPAQPPSPQPQEPPKKPVRHRRPANTNTEVATNASPEVPAIGRLSTGDPQTTRQQTDASILEIEKSLNGITRGLNDQEQKTAAQIREFLKEARAALTLGDLDGAHTLAIKAKVLLDELHP